MEILDPETRRNRKKMIKYFNDLSKYSSWNADHSMEVAKLSRDFSKYLGFSVKHIESSALAHDLGKLKIDKSILHKKGKLSPDERVEMEKHSQYSLSYLDNLTGDLGKFARISAMFHHTKATELDELIDQGKLTDDEVKLIKIITICDIFEALSSTKRPYKEVLSKGEALEIMKGIKVLDQELFKKFEHWQKTHFTNEYRTPIRENLSLEFLSSCF